MSKEYLEGANPLFIEGSTTGVLLIHGAGGGTTWDLKEFTNIVHEITGASVYVPALSGFGTRPEDLYAITFTDWLDDAKSAYEKLEQTCDKIFIVGHSMGGVLSLHLASKYPQTKAIVTWAAATAIKNKKLSLLPILMKTPILNRFIPERIDTPAPEELKKLGWVGYDWLPITIAFAILEGLKSVKNVIPLVKCPVLIIQGMNDEIVPQKCAKTIYNNVGSNVKEIWMVEGASHPLMNETCCKKELFERTISFLRKWGL
ncbi:MAG: alpha/beta hydrolase [Candidatus Hodarchaeales archaeon]